MNKSIMKPELDIADKMMISTNVILLVCLVALTIMWYYTMKYN